jgi:hypothetical protein
VLAGLTRYWPRVHDVEGAGMANYTPPAPSFLDYNQTADLTLPIIFFGNDFGCFIMGAYYDPTSTVPEGQSVQPRTASTDVTSNILRGYGHLDIYSGTHSLQDVKEKMLGLMNERLK